jgi:hypothetical protein
MPILKLVLFIWILTFITGCASIPLTDGGIAVGKDTTVGIEDLGVASVTKGF